MTMQGVDISAYQSGPPGGKDFYLIKATEGTSYVDSLMPGWLAEVERWGKLAGVYHFFHPSQGGVAQADYFLEKVGPYLKPGVTLWLDHETASGTPAEDAAQADAFLRRVQEKRPGWTPGLYTYQAFVSEGRCAGLGWAPLWLARIGGLDSAGIGPWKSTFIQQYGQSPEDLDACFGTAADWRRLGGGGSAPVSTSTSWEEDDMLIQTPMAATVPWNLGSVASVIITSPDKRTLTVNTIPFDRAFTVEVDKDAPGGFDLGAPGSVYGIEMPAGSEGVGVLPAGVPLAKRGIKVKVAS